MCACIDACIHIFARVGIVSDVMLRGDLVSTRKPATTRETPRTMQSTPATTVGRSTTQAAKPTVPRATTARAVIQRSLHAANPYPSPSTTILRNFVLPNLSYSVIQLLPNSLLHYSSHCTAPAGWPTFEQLCPGFTSCRC